MLFGVVLEELDSRDSGFVNVANGAFLVRISDGGKEGYSPQ